MTPTDPKTNHEKEDCDSATPPSSSSQPTVRMPPWQAPQPSTITHDPGVYLYNSLTRSKTKLLAQDGGRQLVWYMCGPTVYDASHMGHARTYLGFDIMRRVLQDYFQFQVQLIMNITDVDDKIIARAASQHVSDFRSLTQQYETSFWNDLQELHVLPVTNVTRVTDYMTEIVHYIQELVQDHAAYESNGSVYFRVERFEQQDQCYYAKLAPEQKHNATLLQEGEGILSSSSNTPTNNNNNNSNEFKSEKESDRDFCLWKKSKPGEPVWSSPWGDGRPGWHIECSVMATHVMQHTQPGTTRMDLHSGGIDLKFPHHDNEMAQAEAHCHETQWVNYFVHAGHLHIQGLKMSKSLKNFITIQQALELHSARQIRILFLLHKYNAPMDYGDNTMSHAVATEKTIHEFFHKTKAFLRTHPSTKGWQKWNEAAYALQRTLQYHIQPSIHRALQDDMDTPTMMNLLLELIRHTHVYMMMDPQQQQEQVKVGLVVRNVATYLTRMLHVVGVIPTYNPERIGWDNDEGTTTGGGSTREDILTPVLDAMVQFRNEIRQQTKNNPQELLNTCDRFRDEVLPPLGIRLEDTGDGVWKLEDPVALQKELALAQVEAERKMEEKAAAAAAAQAKQALNALPPTEFLKQLTIETTNEDETTKKDAVLMYSQFDDTTGMPTHDHTGTPLNKNQTKKAQKMYAAQQKKYEKYLQSHGGDKA